MSRHLKNRVLLITGASSGIGAAVALEAARAGMHVAMCARRIDKLEVIAAQIRQLGQQALTMQADVTSDADMQQFVAATVQQWGRLDVVYANAGYGQRVGVMDMTEQDMRRMFEVNYFGTIRIMREALPHLKNAPGGGHMVICSSAASEIGLPLYGVYSATKAAQDSIAGAMRLELEDQGIIVTSVHPIGTHTEFFDHLKQGPTQLPANTPDALMQSADHVARCIVRAMRKPRAEVWPSLMTRFALALTTAFPGLGLWLMRRHYRRIR